MKLTFIFTACESDNTFNPNNSPETEHYLELSESELIFDERGGTKELNISCDGLWLMGGVNSANHAWCRFNNYSGRGDTTIQVMVASNNQKEQRSAVLTIMSEKTYKLLVIKQEAVNPFFYELEFYFPEGATIEAKPESERTNQEKQDLIAMMVVLHYLIDNQYIKNRSHNQPVFFEGDDGSNRDPQAIQYYEAKKAALDNVDFAKLLSDEKAKEDSELTGSGSFTFIYSMRKGLDRTDMPDCKHSYTVNY